MTLRNRCRGSVLVLSAAFAAAANGGQARCAGDAVTEVRTIEELPDSLRQLLPAARSGVAGIADRDARFSATDVVDPELPMRRFTLAALGASCAVIAVEYGGRAHGFELTEYRRSKSGWAAVGHHSVSRQPATTADLLQN